MAKFKVIYQWNDGTTEEEDELYDSYKEAEEAGLIGLSNYAVGQEVLELSNPGDWADEEIPEDFEIEEV